MWEALKELAPWVALLVVALDRVFAAGKLSAVLDRLATAVDKLADQVADHDTQLAVQRAEIENLRDRR